MLMPTLMRFLGCYIAVVLAAYSVSASWSLGVAADRVALAAGTPAARTRRPCAAR